jgi:hypothetical protein
MSDSCPGCFQSAKGQQAEYEKILNQAREYSKENKKAVAVYKEGGEYKYLDAFEAYARGYGPVIRDVVSAHNGIATT